MISITNKPSLARSVVTTLYSKPITSSSSSYTYSSSSKYNRYSFISVCRDQLVQYPPQSNDSPILPYLISSSLLQQTVLPLIGGNSYFYSTQSPKPKQFKVKNSPITLNNNNNTYNNNNNNINGNSNNNIENSINNNNPTPTTRRKVTIKIKSKDPFIELPNNQKIYLGPKKRKSQTKAQEEQPVTSLSTEQVPLNTQVKESEPLKESTYNQNQVEQTNNLHQQEVEEVELEKVKVLKQEEEVEEMTSVERFKDINKSQEKDGQEPVEKVKSIKLNRSTKDTPHTVIIDGTPLAYKAYSTIASLTCNGEPVGVVYGFTKSLLKIIKETKPDYLVVCFDPAQGGSFRRDIYPEYKANRPPVPADLKQQFTKLPEVTAALGVQFAQQERFESDDLIATYARVAEERGHAVTIISDDKDLMQLITESTYMYSPRLNQIYDKNDVFKKMGVDSNLITSLQALTGDSVDNIPGVPSLGPKNAASIVNRLGRIENILDNIESIPIRYQEKVSALKDQIMLSFQLATLNRHINTNISYDQLKYNPIKKEKLIEFFDKYSFNELKKTIDKLKLRFEGQEDYNGADDSISLASDDTDDLSLSSLSITSETSTTITKVKKTRKSSKKVKDEEDAEKDQDEEDDGDDVVINNSIIDDEPLLTDEQVKDYVPPNVTLVNTVEHAKEIVAKLQTLKDVYHACDTEVVGLDLKKESPIGHGRVICFSIYCGPDINFGTGSRIWVDVLGDNGQDILDVFKVYFADESIFKVWHNYAFDRHVLFNHGVDVVGLGGDTMHMARLWDASRLTRGGYSLEGLSKDLLDKHKTSMKDLFGVPKLKRDGTPGSIILLPELDRIQRSKRHLSTWIEYSSLDAEVTWQLREYLHRKLLEMEWIGPNSTMWDFYHTMWRPFAHLLTNMERIGMKLDIQHLANLEVQANSDIQENRKIFNEWALKQCDGAKYMNMDSDAQIQQLLFAPCSNTKTKEVMGEEEEFECENTEGFIEAGKTRAKKNRPFVLRGLGFPYTTKTASGWPSVDSASLKTLAGKNPKEGQYGTLYKHLMSKVDKNATPEEIEQATQKAKEASIAIAALLEVGSISTLINTFIVPLQRLADSNHRVHTSVGINTETGRLSSKRPNLQNQPALEKDRYKIRKAFTCEPGNTLIVADYGQLELRLLAHITNCKSMIEAFKVGGDFHSRTALGMYPHIQKEIEKGNLLLEWEGKDEPPLPLLKDKFASERRKAKTLNFSIAYGKTAHGLSKDWGVSLKEAQQTLDLWYESRPEVMYWQRRTIQTAHEKKWTRTLMGRYRLLPDIDNKFRASHAERASINTPLQGGAADIVMKAMLVIDQDKRLKELGFQLIMQIHDELILEGPEQHAQEAKEIMVKLMNNPLNSPLLIDLVVDCHFAKTWYEAK